jgi:ribosome maturation factor RimP
MSEKIEEMIRPVVNGLGCQLWGIEILSQGKYSVLKIYIDAEKGIEVDDCARISRQVSALLDVEEPFKGNYTLEVSSPGLDRRLFELDQYDAYKGAQVKLSLRRPYEGRRRFTGILCGIEGEDVVLRSDSNEEILFPFEQIDRANIIPDI